MKLIEVSDPFTRKAFLKLPLRLYKDDPHWIRPLDVDIADVFNPHTNEYFSQGECIRWILQDENEETIGRIAAFINQKTAYSFDQPTGGIGFFECINDQQAAFMLFDQCKNWLEERGMEAMDGPINFGHRDRWWGLLVEGFYPPNYCANYNPLYYKDLFEAYGFKTYFNQYTYYRKISEDSSDKIKQKAARIKRNPDYTFAHATLKHLDKYVEDFRTVYNKAWTSHEEGIEEMTQIQAKELMKKLKPILDVELLWYAYYQGEPIAFFLCIPDVNQYIRHVNGKLNFWGKLKFLYHKLMKHCNKAIGIIFGVIPRFQGRGIESAIVDAFSTVAWADGFPYEHIEMSWIGDFNPTMMQVAENVGGSIHKKHITYRKLFDASKPFKRAPIIGKK